MSSSKIIVANLSYQTKEEEINEIFSKFGEINSIQMGKGKAIIDFKNEDSVQKAFSLDKTVIKERTILIQNIIESNRIVVFNLPPKVKVNEVKKIFSECGPILRINLLFRNCFIDYETVEGAKNAISYDKTELFGNIIKIEYSQEKPNTETIQKKEKPPKEIKIKDKIKNIKSDGVENKKISIFGFQNNVQDYKIPLRKLFSKFGKIKNMTFSTSGDQTFITYQKVDMARDAVKNNNKLVFEGMVLSVQYSKVKLDKEKKEVISNIVSVTNLPEEKNKEKFRELFSKYGKVLNIEYNFLETSLFITLDSHDSANKSLALNGVEFEGKLLSVCLMKNEIVINENKRIVVNLPNDYEKAEIQEYFSECGEIENISYNSSNTVAFIEYKELESARKAIELNDKLFNNSKLKVQYSKEKEKTVNESNSINVLNPQSNIRENISEIFKDCGEIINIESEESKITIDFDKVESANKAMLLNNKIFYEEELNLERSKIRLKGATECIQIMNLPITTNEKLMRDEFSKYGKIIKIVLNYEKDVHGKIKPNNAFVQYQNAFQSKKAVMNMNGKLLENQKIKVIFTKKDIEQEQLIEEKKAIKIYNKKNKMVSRNLFSSVEKKIEDEEIDIFQKEIIENKKNELKRKNDQKQTKENKKKKF
jgi:RNA recognition motif-containing protein